MADVYSCPLYSLVFVFSTVFSPQMRPKLSKRHTIHIYNFVLLFLSRAESERNPWVLLTSALLTQCQGSEVKLDLGQQVVTMARSLYNTKHKLPAQVNNKHSFIQPVNAYVCFTSQ